MSVRSFLTLGGLCLLLAATLGSGCRPSAPQAPDQPAEEAVVVRGPLALSTSVEGSLEARRVETILSRFQGRATLIDLVPEGTQVTKGDRLARFDASQLENDLVKLRNELTRAEAVMDSLENAELPLEKQDLAVQLGEAQYLYDTESQILVDTRELADRKLVSPREIEQQTLRLATLAAKQAQLRQRGKLMDEHLHPARLTQARANLEAARQQIALAQEQLSNCVISAPSSGLAVYLPLHVGNEFRTIRVGDTVYPNQPFLCLPDMTDFIAQGFIPESELARVQPGQKTVITPLAYPDCHLAGTVETLGVMAQSRPGYPLWQKFFHLAIRIDQKDARLRPGMSLRMEISAGDRPDAVLIPRRAVQWEGDTPFCSLRSARGLERRPLKLGPGNERWFEVLEGVAPGDRIVSP
jgi:HlyD family secretion protein